MTRQRKGILLIVLADVLFSIDKLTGNSILGFIGGIICGDNYLKSVAGDIDMSCGFNYEIYFFLFLLAILLVGLAMIIIPIIKRKISEKNSHKSKK